MPGRYGWMLQRPSSFRKLHFPSAVSSPFILRWGRISPSTTPSSILSSPKRRLKFFANLPITCIYPEDPAQWNPPSSTAGRTALTVSAACFLPCHFPHIICRQRFPPALHFFSSVILQSILLSCKISTHRWRALYDLCLVIGSLHQFILLRVSHKAHLYNGHRNSAPINAAHGIRFRHTSVLGTHDCRHMVYQRLGKRLALIMDAGIVGA